jgi:hypothetical protein
VLGLAFIVQILIKSENFLEDSVRLLLNYGTASLKNEYCDANSLHKKILMFATGILKIQYLQGFMEY